jgi:phosphoribosylamine-glycine ligase
MTEAAERFRAAVVARDPDAMEAVLADEVVFRSPAVHEAYAGKVATMVLLRSVLRVFEDFRYTRSFTSEEGSGHVLEFSARVGDREVQGVDVLTVGEDDLVTELTVLIRPLSGLNAVVARMGEVIPQVTAELGLA